MPEEQDHGQLDIAWQAVSLSSGLLAGTVARKATAATWKAATGREVPDNPAAPGVRWVEAIGFAVVSGAALGLVRMLAQRGAAAGWHAVVGDYPPALAEGRNED